MGIINDLIYVQKHADSFKGPFLEVGSKDYGNTQPIREIFSSKDTFIGVDIESGLGVDIVMDLGDALASINQTLGGLKFGTIFCMNVLEHCENPFQMADNLTNLLSSDGAICLSVPFACAFHGYPSDYWRFTHEGIKKLFPELTFEQNQMEVASSRMNDFSKVDNEIGKLPFSSRHYFRKGQYYKGISSKVLKFLSNAGVFPIFSRFKYVLPTSIIYMIGYKRDSGR